MPMNMEEATAKVIRNATADHTVVNEASLAHIVNKQTSGYCIVSACRHDWVERKRAAFERGEEVQMPVKGKPSDTLSVRKDTGIGGELQKAFDDNAYWNRAMSQQLRRALSKAGIGFVPVYGGFREGDTEVVEASYILMPMNHNHKGVDFEKVRDTAIELGIKYGQDSVAICPPNEAPYFYVTRDYTDKNGVHKVGDEQRWFKKGMKLNDVTEEFFTSLNKVHEHPTDGRGATVKRFSYIDESIRFNPDALSLSEGHMRWAEGEIFRMKR